MSLLSRVSGFWRRGRMTEAQMRDTVNAAYYSAASDSASMDFSFANNAGINTALLADLNTLRARCRYELRQNGIAKGIPRIYANSVIGPGPQLSLVGGDDAWGQKVEEAFLAWARSCDFMGGVSLGCQLHLGVRQLFPVGEYFLVQRSAPRGAVRLRYLMVRPDRVETPFASGEAPSKAMIDKGVEVDADGRPVAYYILQGDSEFSPYSMRATGDYQRVPADKVIHVFYREDPAQHRGEPWMAASLPGWHKLRRYDEAQIAAAIVAAKFAAVLVNTNPDVVADAGKILPTSVLEIQDGMMMVPPPGYEPKQVDPKQPNANSSEFRRDIIAAAGAATALPANIATQDSSKSSFASARFDGVGLLQDGAVLHSVLEGLHLRRVYEAFLAEAVAAGVVRGIPEDARGAPVWRWQKEDRHSDPQKAAVADDVRLKNATTTVGSVMMGRGIDREEGRRELLEEIQWFRKNKIRHPLDMAAGDYAVAIEEGGGEGEGTK